MADPIFANTWYQTPRVEELRQEIQNLYKTIDESVSAIGSIVDGRVIIENPIHLPLGAGEVDFGAIRTGDDEPVGNVSRQALVLTTEGILNDHTILQTVTGEGLGLSVQNSGRVGIGSANPAEKLHLHGPGAYLLIRSQDNTANAVHNSGLKFVTDVNARRAEIRPVRGSSSFETGLQINTHINDEQVVAVRIQPAGDVGIGTDDPDEKLDVRGNAVIVGNLHVTGNITADGDCCA